MKNLVLRQTANFSLDLKKSGRIHRVLVTGANGQLGQGLGKHLEQLYGAGNVMFSDVQEQCKRDGVQNYQQLDCMDKDRVEGLINDFKPQQVIHLAAILSASGEKNPQLAYRVNVDSFKHVLDACVYNSSSIFSPSSIAAFGASTPLDNTPNTTIMRPETMYGATKVFNELLGEYYFRTLGVDFRCLRYPQVLSSDRPHGGTGDYSVDMFYQALEQVNDPSRQEPPSYTCYIEQDEYLPMIYIDDLIEGTLQFLETPREKLSSSVYNIQGCSFSPNVLHTEIVRHIKNLRVDYEVDFRQQIAQSWPNSLDDQLARKDWNWNPKYPTHKLVDKMIADITPIVNSQ